MSIQIPSIAPFDPTEDTTSTAQRWEKWVKSFQYFVIASNINNNERKRALLLHLIGPESQEIFDTLPDTGNTFEEALTALEDYFKVKKNVPYERSVFGNAKQDSTESIEQFVTRLRKLSMNCEYGNKQSEHIRDQVIRGCKSSRFRTKLLEKKDLTLDDVLEIGKTREAAAHQSKQMDAANNNASATEGSVNELKKKPFRHRNRKFHTPANNNNKGQRDNQFRSGPSQPTQPRKLSCGRCGATGHKSHECRQSKNATCDKCKKTGHFTKMCFTKGINNIDTTLPGLISDSDSSDDDNFHVFAFKNVKTNSATTKIKINNNSIDALVDSGSSINLIDESTYQNMKPRPILQKSRTKIFPYQSSTPLKVKGAFNGLYESHSRYVNAQIIVLQGQGKSILSKDTAEKLDLLRVGPPKHSQVNKISQVPESVHPILEDNKEVFNGHGLLKDTEVKIHIDPEVNPVQQRTRRIPWHTRKKVSDELKRLKDLDIIEKCNGPTS